MVRKTVAALILCCASKSFAYKASTKSWDSVARDSILNIGIMPAGAELTEGDFTRTVYESGATVKSGEILVRWCGSGGKDIVGRDQDIFAIYSVENGNLTDVCNSKFGRSFSAAVSYVNVYYLPAYNIALAIYPVQGKRAFYSRVSVLRSDFKYTW